MEYVWRHLWRHAMIDSYVHGCNEARGWEIMSVRCKVRGDIRINDDTKWSRKKSFFATDTR